MLHKHDLNNSNLICVFLQPPQTFNNQGYVKVRPELFSSLLSVGLETPSLKTGRTLGPGERRSSGPSKKENPPFPQRVKT